MYTIHSCLLRVFFFILDTLYEVYIRHGISKKAIYFKFILNLENFSTKITVLQIYIIQRKKKKNLFS